MEQEGERLNAMEAWKRIGRNLHQLYRIRAERTGGKGYDSSDLEAEVIAFGALQRLAEQEKHGTGGAEK